MEILKGGVLGFPCCYCAVWIYLPLDSEVWLIVPEALRVQSQVKVVSWDCNIYTAHLQSHDLGTILYDSDFRFLLEFCVYMMFIRV